MRSANPICFGFPVPTQEDKPPVVTHLRGPPLPKQLDDAVALLQPKARSQPWRRSWMSRRGAREALGSLLCTAPPEAHRSGSRRWAGLSLSVLNTPKYVISSGEPHVHGSFVAVMTGFFCLIASLPCGPQLHLSWTPRGLIGGFLG